MSPEACRADRANRGGELAGALQAITSSGMLADMVAAFMDIPAAEKQEVLETLDVRERLEAGEHANQVVVPHAVQEGALMALERMLSIIE